MKITVKRFTHHYPHLDGGTYKTSVTIRTDGVITGVVLNGHLTRKEAIRQAYNHYLDDPHWSDCFARQIWDTAIKYKTGSNVGV